MPSLPEGIMPNPRALELRDRLLNRVTPIGQGLELG